MVGSRVAVVSMGRAIAEVDATRYPEPQPEIIGCSGESDAELALALQLTELQEAAQASPTSGVASQQQSMHLKLSDPIWGDLLFVGKGPTTWDKLCFGCCPCFYAGCSGAWNCCSPGREVTASLSPMRAWKRVMSSFSLWISVAQVLIFIVVFASSDGIVSMDRNAMIGPHPHFLDKSGAKNAARIVLRNEWWRLLSPLLLHGGIIHLSMNVLVQLKLGLLLEVLWDSHAIFLMVYWTSGLYSIIASCIFLPNTITVGSSGAVCGLIGAELVFILVTWRQTLPNDVAERNLQLVAVGLTIAVTAGLSFLPLVDSAAHGGGFVVGAALGLVFFAERMKEDYSRLFRVAMMGTGATIVILLIAGSMVYLVTEVEPDRSLLKLCLPPDC